MLAYAIGVCIHPRLAACLEKEHTLAYVTAYASCIEEEEEHTLAYASTHASVSINARLASRIEKDENSDGDPQTQNYAKHATELQQSCNRAATVTATYRRRISRRCQCVFKDI